MPGTVAGAEVRGNGSRQAQEIHTCGQRKVVGLFLKSAIEMKCDNCWLRGGSALEPAWMEGKVRSPLCGPCSCSLFPFPQGIVKFQLSSQHRLLPG